MAHRRRRNIKSTQSLPERPLPDLVTDVPDRISGSRIDPNNKIYNGNSKRTIRESQQYDYQYQRSESREDYNELSFSRNNSNNNNRQEFHRQQERIEEGNYMMISNVNNTVDLNRSSSSSKRKQQQQQQHCLADSIDTSTTRSNFSDNSSLFSGSDKYSIDSGKALAAEAAFQQRIVEQMRKSRGQFRTPVGAIAGFHYNNNIISRNNTMGRVGGSSCLGEVATTEILEDLAENIVPQSQRECVNMVARKTSKAMSDYSTNLMKNSSCNSRGAFMHASKNGNDYDMVTFNRSRLSEESFQANMSNEVDDNSVTVPLPSDSSVYSTKSNIIEDFFLTLWRCG